MTSVSFKQFSAAAATALVAVAGYTYREAVSSVTSRALSSPSIRYGGSLVGVVAGGLAVASSRIFTVAKQQIMGLKPREEAVPLTLGRAVSAGLGLALVGACLYVNFQSFAELNALYAASDSGQLGLLSAKQESCLEARYLKNEVILVKRHSVRFAEPQELQGLGKSYLDPRARVIKLSRDLDQDGRLAHVIHHMCVAKGFDGQWALANATRHCLVGFPSFEQARWKSEWLSVHCQHDVATACIESQGWNASVDLHRHVLRDSPTLWAKDFVKSLSEYLKQAIAGKNKHADFAKQEWNMLRQEGGCSDLPTSLCGP